MHFSTPDGAKIHWDSNISPNDRAVVVINHGLAEHLGRYKELRLFLKTAEVGSAIMDLRGHGKSSGRRTYIKSFQQYLRDADQFLGLIKEKVTVPVYLLGHSLGGLVWVRYLQEYGSNVCDGLILSSPALAISQEISPLLQRMSGVIGTLFPKLPTIKLNADHVSRDKNVVEAYKNDPMNYTDRLLAGPSYLSIKATKRAQKNFEHITCPLLVMHGGNDKMASIAGSKLLYNKSTSDDKELKVFTGLYHEIFNEPERLEVFYTVKTWLNDRI